MRKKLLFISLVLSLVLAALMPGVALAAKPTDFEAEGIITDITDGVVSQAGRSSRFLVTERQISGEMSGDIVDDYVFTYRGNVDVQTQAGTVHGTVVFDTEPYVLDVNGRIEPVELTPTPGLDPFFMLVVDWYLPGDLPGEPSLPAGTLLPAGFPMPKLTISGRWIFTEEDKGQGTLDAEVYFTTDAEGHVNHVYFSSFDLTGKSQ